MNMVCNRISDLIHRKVSWLVLAETRLVITSLLLEMSACASADKVPWLLFRGKQCDVDPSSLLADFVAHVITF